MVWPTEVTGLTSVGFDVDESYHFSGNFRRSGKADESYLTSVGPMEVKYLSSLKSMKKAYLRRSADGSFYHYCSERDV
jgi:hypothetical protein